MEKGKKLRSIEVELSLMILAHVFPPNLIFQILSFDVPLMFF